MPVVISRHFVTVGQRQVHYRRAGEGPPVVLLHQSPSWALALDPYTRAFADAGFTAIALDTPGYGLSDLLPLEKPEIPDYAEALRETLDALGLKKIGLFGSHTGASIAIEFARRHPERVAMTLFDGYPAYTDAERAEMLEHYLPPFVSRWDGSHLISLWHKFREQMIFQPTFVHHRENRADNAPMPAAAMQPAVLPRLITAEAYAIGYSSVFRYRGLEPLSDLKAPACFGMREGDGLMKGVSLLPPGSWTEILPRDIPTAAAAYAQLMKRHVAPETAPPPPAAKPIKGRIIRRYIDTRFGQMMVRQAGDGAGLPLVLVPQMPGGGDLRDDLLQELAAKRIVLAIDMPGQGDSDAVAAPPSAALWADGLEAALDALKLPTVLLHGHNGGASVAALFAQRHPQRVAKLILEGPLALPEPLRQALQHRYAEPIVPQWDGAHWLRLWFTLRNEQLFWPWYNETLDGVRHVEPEIEPRHLTRKLTGILKHYTGYAPTWQAAFGFALPPILAQIAVPTLVCARENDVFAAFAEDAARTVPGAHHAALPFDATGAARVLSDFLG